MVPDRDSPLYPWHRRPADHNPAGLFVDGPQLSAPPVVKLQGQTRSPVNVPSPAQVRARAQLTLARKLERLRELEALVAVIRARSAS